MKISEFITLIFSGVIAAATAAQVCVYIKQSAILRDSIDAASRPYIKIRISGDSMSGPSLPRLSPNFFVENVGKLPVIADIQGGADWSSNRHQRSVLAYNAIEQRFIFPNSGEQQFAILNKISISDGEYKDLQEEGGFYYIYVKITYGNYVVRLCNAYETNITDHGFSLAKPKLCQDPDSNYAS
jgi:hypothetical protein